jgi:hypothetical protein
MIYYLADFESKKNMAQKLMERGTDDGGGKDRD